MPSHAMAVFANVLLFVGTMVSGVKGTTPYTNGVSTETLAPQELGYVTSAGSLVYSVNMCSIVHSTVCQPSVSAAGGHPSPAPGYSSGKVEAATSRLEQPPASAAKATIPVTTPTTMTKGTPSPYSTSTTEAAEVIPTETQDFQPTSNTVSPVPVSTGASNSVSVVRGVAIGAGAMAVALLF